MSRQLGWIAIQVDLIEGRGEAFWPRPGRTLAASRVHSFADLAAAIDGWFARWDRAHLHEFRLGDGTRIGTTTREFEEEEPVLDDRIVNLSRLKPGEQFSYVFDLGDDWAHLCTVGREPIDPLKTLGVVATRPQPDFGWGTIPDQYGRLSSSEGAEDQPPPDPEFSDLAPLVQDWGPAESDRK